VSDVSVHALHHSGPSIMGVEESYAAYG